MSKRIILFVALPSELPKELVPDGVEIHYTGVGKVNAAIKAVEVLKVLNPNDVVVLNYGSAGGGGTMVGKLFKCKTFVQRDMDARPFAERGITPFDDIVWIGLGLETSSIDFNGLGYHTCHTQDWFESSPNMICDMEAYSLAKVCKIYGFDFTSYKYVSDSGNPDDWEANHNKGTQLFLNELNK